MRKFDNKPLPEISISAPGLNTSNSWIPLEFVLLILNKLNRLIPSSSFSYV